MKKFNWGIIGTGWIAHDMADALNKVNGEIYAAANPNEEALNNFVQEKHVQHAFTDPDKMIADPNVDIIYIATPHTFHYDYIKRHSMLASMSFAKRQLLSMRGNLMKWLN